MADRITNNVNLSGRSTTAGTAEETLDLSLNGGSAAANTIIPDGSHLTISDVTLTSGDSTDVTNYRFQVSTDGGGNWNDYGQWTLPSAGTVGQEFGAGIVFDGGSDTRIRLRVETTGAASLVTATLQGYLSTDA